WSARAGWYGLPDGLPGLPSETSFHWGEIDWRRGKSAGAPSYTIAQWYRPCFYEARSPFYTGSRGLFFHPEGSGYRTFRSHPAPCSIAWNRFGSPGFFP